MATTTVARPLYSDLPNGIADGVFGDADQLGCLNLLTRERTLRAARLVRSGEALGLNGSLKDWPNPNPFGAGGRKPLEHHVTGAQVFRDDYYDGFYPQAGSQWDHFLHHGDPVSGKFYNGLEDGSIGIAAWAPRGIVGRGVLLDVAKWLEAHGTSVDLLARIEITVEHLEACASAEGVSIDEGTVLLVRFGWEAGYKKLSWDERVALSERGIGGPGPGLSSSPEMAARLWDWGVAAIGADNPALEAWPPRGFGGEWPPSEDTLHTHLLGRLGMPIAELLLLDDLAEACAKESRYEFLFASAPLNCYSGVGSTANAIAVL